MLLFRNCNGLKDNRYLLKTLFTGSNGKSTTTALAADMIAAAGINTVPGGNLGRAFSEIVDEENEVEVIVLELSSFQLEHVDTFRAETGVLLNVTPDHLDRYPTIESSVFIAL